MHRNGQKGHTMSYCEDYPACGHTGPENDDPCDGTGNSEEWYYRQALRALERDDDGHMDY
jgi:hypothetical protein